MGHSTFWPRGREIQPNVEDPPRFSARRPVGLKLRTLFRNESSGSEKKGSWKVADCQRMISWMVIVADNSSMRIHRKIVADKFKDQLIEVLGNDFSAAYGQHALFPGNGMTAFGVVHQGD